LLPTDLQEKKQYIVKNLVGNLWTVDESIVNKYIDGYKACKKKSTHFIPSVAPLVNLAHHR
jgi:hypothetical protein